MIGSNSIDASRNEVSSENLDELRTRLVKPLYAITFKPVFKSYIKKCILDPEYIYDIFSSYCKIHDLKVIDQEREFDSKGVPHIHAMIEKNDRLLKCNNVKGIHIFIVRIYDKDRWIGYIKKDAKKEVDDYSFID